jgi:hypothetical protein
MRRHDDVGRRRVFADVAETSESRLGIRSA